MNNPIASLYSAWADDGKEGRERLTVLSKLKKGKGAKASSSLYLQVRGGRRETF